MKSKNTRKPMIISAAAATRLFLRIASLGLRPEFKLDLLTTVSDIIEGRREISDADLSLPEEKEIGRDLAKAIERSAKARAAAARRREARAAAVAGTEAETKVEEEISGSTEIAPAGGISVGFSSDQAPAAVGEDAETPEAPVNAFSHSGKRRRNRRRRRRKS